ncbi:orotidine-5'-phosphate decarboxylase [Candidatus Saccharibacteria bacterium]|nr:MAG: orotidine-5'-phosphate decarboxylase [Candidatus Saccharibacteria bacterium]
MTFSERVQAAAKKNNSLLCVGLDPDSPKLPKSVADQTDAYFQFCKAIVDATADLACAFKPNSAFFEGQGADGVAHLKQLCDYIKQAHPDIPIILDSKRADIGNTNNGYVAQSFDYLGADAVTVHPYLGQEALEPFLSQAEKGIIILCRTSNPGAGEFQDLLVDGKPVYQHVAERVATTWNTNKNCLLVVGATYPDEIAEVRNIVGPDMFLLIPGIGAQGGDLEKTVKAGGENVLINSSRAILYASSGDDYADAARTAALEFKDEINKYR